MNQFEFMKRVHDGVAMFALKKNVLITGCSFGGFYDPIKIAFIGENDRFECRYTFWNFKQLEDEVSSLK